MLKSLAKAVSRDSIRPALNCIHITSKYAEATDGHIVVRKPIDKETNSGEYLINAVENKIDFEYLDLNGLETKDNGEVILQNGRKIPKTDESINGDYPDIDKVFPDGEPVIRIGLNLSVLKKFIDATGTLVKKSNLSDTFIFEFYGSLKAVKVTQTNLWNDSDEPITGLIMPVRIP